MLIVEPPFEYSETKTIKRGLKLSRDEFNPNFLAKDSLTTGSLKLASFLKTYAV